MRIRADIAELLHAGHSDSAIARHLHVPKPAVAQARTALDLPPHKPGLTPAATPADLFWRRVQPTDDGHLLWAGHRNPKGLPCLRHGGRLWTAYRIAFRIGHGRDPVGHVTVDCGRDGCVHPDCTVDRLVREANRRADAVYDADLAAARP